MVPGQRQTKAGPATSPWGHGLAEMATLGPSLLSLGTVAPAPSALQAFPVWPTRQGQSPQNHSGLHHSAPPQHRQQDQAALLVQVRTLKASHSS